MLVLSRKRDESICIGDNVRVTVLEITGERVRLGITAPREIAVNRFEIAQRIAREPADRLAAGPSPCFNGCVIEAVPLPGGEGFMTA